MATLRWLSALHSVIFYSIAPQRTIAHDGIPTSTGAPRRPVVPDSPPDPWRWFVPPLFQSIVPGIPCRRGKVRDVYDLGDRLVLVATDRLSAFDWVLPSPIPDKGRILTALTCFWLDLLAVPHHLLSTDLADMGPAFVAQRGQLEGRSCLVRKTRVIPVECVARGFLAGSGWKEYQAGGTVCGLPLPPGLRQAERLSEAIFTPATKEESGHDQNIDFGNLVGRVGPDLAATLRERTLTLYQRGADHARSRGILLADTKFEWGTLATGELILIDEVLTPDSSRFWPADAYQVGGSPPSFDKQFVRDWLESTTWDKNSPPPPLPQEVVDKTRARYVEAFERLTGQGFR
jgi:phosphoribosylaminoimidazole-succinocarboxamide synthase